MLYSKEVNEHYYNHNENEKNGYKKQLLAKNIDRIRTEIATVLKTTIFQAIQAIYALLTSIHRIYAVTSPEDQFANPIHKEIINQVTKEIIQQITSNKEVKDNILDALATNKGEIQLNQAIKDLLISELSTITQIIIDKIDCFVKKNKYSYKSYEFKRIFDFYKKDFTSYWYEHMYKTLLEKLKDSEGWIACINNNENYVDYTFANSTNNLHEPLAVDNFPKLLGAFWGITNVQRVTTGSNAYNYLKHLGFQDQEILPEAYLTDFSNLSVEDKYIKESFSSMRIEALTPYIVFLFGKNLQNITFNYYIENNFTKVFFEKLESELNSIPRKTLADDHKFESKNYIDFLSNLRLLNRSQTRKIKNFKHQQVGSSKETTHHNWYLGNHGFAPESNELNHRDKKGRSRLDKVDSAGSYQEVYENLEKYKKYFNPISPNFITDADIAIWIKEIIVNKEKLSKIDDPFNPYTESQIATLKKDLVSLAYLLFGCEVVRNPASIPIHQMMLDLIANNKLTWKDALTKTLTDNKLESGGRMPMSAKGAIAAGRKLHNQFNQYMPHSYSYQGSDKVSSDITDVEMAKKESWILREWLKLDRLGNKKVTKQETLFTRLKPYAEKNWLNLEIQKTKPNPFI